MKESIWYKTHDVISMVKNIFLILLLLATLQSCRVISHHRNIEEVGYHDQWKQVDSLVDLQLPKSALDIIEDIKESSRQQAAWSDHLKSIIYQNRLQSQFEDWDLSASIERMEQDLIDLPQPAASVLHSLLGELYDHYIQQSLWRLVDQISREDISEDEQIDRLSLKALRDRAISQYQHSTAWAFLDSVPIEEFASVVIPDTLANSRWKTLLDVLGHRAISFFSVDPVTGPGLSRRVPFTNPEFFTSLDSFTALSIPVRGSHSLNDRALNLYQKLIAARMKDHDSSALVELDLERLQFVYRQSAVPGKDSLYVNALRNLSMKYRSSDSYSEIIFALASHLHNQPDSLAFVTSHELCEDAIRAYPDSYGAALCQNLIRTIEMKQLRIEVEEVLLPLRPSLIKVNYRNFKDLTLKIFKLNHQLFQQMTGLDQEDLIRELGSQRIIDSSGWELPLPRDFREHSVELIVPDLPPGRYAIIAGSDPELEVDQEAVSVIFFQVSNLSYSEVQSSTGQYYLCVHRGTGNPLEDVNVSWMELNRDRSNWRVVGQTKTDSSGRFQIDQQYRSVQIMLVYQNDTLWTHDYYYRSDPGQRSRSREEVRFFTDRSIYRPGQILHFKGIALDIDSDEVPAIVPGKEVKVTLYDANNQVVTTKSYLSNEFGSIYGSISIPSRGLLGSMSLGTNVSNQRHFFQVEAYKRPRFFVELDSLDGAFVLNDTIPISGRSASYAGFAVQNAKVVYRVMRKPLYRPFDIWQGSRISQPVAEEQIFYGEGATSSTGAFKFAFVASDHADFRGSQLEFEVIIDVADQSGETQSTRRGFIIGKQPFHVRWDHEAIWAVDQSKMISYSSQNLDGTNVRTTATISLEQLKSPSRFVKERYWDLPDQDFISEKEFTTLFPDDAWKDELNPLSWEVQERIEGVSVPPGSTSIDLHNVLQQEGMYRVIAEVMDEEKNIVTDTLYSTVYDPTGEIIPGRAAYWVAPINESFEPGDTVEIYIGSHDSIWIWLDHSGAIGDKSLWRKYKGWNQIRVPVTEDERGGFVVSLASVFRNRFQSQNLNIEVPWTNKELQIDVATWRNKMAPGERDSFTITVQSEGVGVAGELLLSMYDKSLDQFVSHQWWSDFYPAHRQWMQLRPAGFGTHYSRQFSTNWNKGYVPVPNRIYPGINWFDWKQILWGNPKHRTLEVMQEVAISADAEMGMGGDQSSETNSIGTDLTKMPTRENFDETLFFYPAISIDSNGTARFAFTMNDAVTTWKLMAFAHTKDLAVGYKQLEMISQRPVMVLANMPRFLRRGDSLTVSGRVVNLTDANQEVTAMLNFLDLADSIVLNDRLITSHNPQRFALAPGESRPVFWQVTVPDDLGSNVSYQMMVGTDDFTDGESDYIPILPQRILVTEAVAFQTRGESKDEHDLSDLDRVLADGHDLISLRLEHVSNPVWHVLSSLPYLIKYPHQCTEQIFNRYYAYRVGQHIISSNVEVERMIRQWQRYLESTGDNTAVDHKYSSVDIEETPWVEEKQVEEELMRQLVLLLNENQIVQGLYESMEQLKQMQLPNGAFPWFKEGRENQYVTQYVLEGFGKLKDLQLLQMSPDLEAMVSRASAYLDQQLATQYEEIKRRIRQGETTLEENHLNSLVVHNIYARSFWDQGFGGNINEEASTFYEAQMKRYWSSQGLYTQALIGFIAAEEKDEDLLRQLLSSFSERVFRVDNRAFWKESFGHFWDQLPIETHVALLRFFDTYGDNKDLVEELKNHLLYHRRLNRWGSTKSTSDAIHAILTTGHDWIAAGKSATISVSGQRVEPGLSAGHPSGRWTKSLPVTLGPSKRQFIVIENPNRSPTWTSMTWTYNEKLDRIKQTGSKEFAVEKSIFLRSLTDSGQVLKSVTEHRPKLGDQLVVQLVIQLEESMEFVHLKDLRASGLEPLQQLSGYRWKHGLGFYQSSDDLQTSFFFDYLPRGKHVFQYPLRVAQNGSFAGGVATIQSMYAPEFIAHSAGIRLDLGK